LDSISTVLLQSSSVTEIVGALDTDMSAGQRTGHFNYADIDGKTGTYKVVLRLKNGTDQTTDKTVQLAK
jgi:hypothetical protein